jgi:hypothetical protein
MTILKISNYYLSLPQKPLVSKDFFETSLEAYVLEILDEDATFDLDLFVENLDFDNEAVELLEGVNVKDEDVYLEYTEEGLEDLIQKILDTDSNDEDDVQYYEDRGNEENDY